MWRISKRRYCDKRPGMCLEMLLFIFTAFSLLGTSEAFFFPGPDVCISEVESLDCMCKNRENITISANLNFDIKRITVVGCGVVSVPLGAITHLQLETISFTDIDTLHILPFALVGVQTIFMLKIENIRDFKVRQHGFVGLFNVSNIIIRNVTSKSLNVGSFGGVSNVQNFLIEDSYFEEVQETAFIVTNVTSFSVLNCKFRVIKNMSFLIHNAEIVLFENCDIQVTNNNSFAVSYVANLSFLNCRFGVLASTSILSTFLQTFSFQNCTVEELESDAFSLVDASEKITFTYNVIKIADEYSLIPSTGTYSSKYVDIEDCCNFLTCDCNIYWLWESSEEGSYRSLLESSFCIEKPETNLSSLEPVFDSSKNCMTLELKIFLPNAKSSTELMQKSTQMKLYESKLIFLLLLLGLFVYMF